MTKSNDITDFIDHPENKFPDKEMTLLTKAAGEGKKVHIRGEAGWGRGTLLRALVKHVHENERIIITDESARTYAYYDDSKQNIAEFSPKVGFIDPGWAILRSRPDTVVVNGDNVLQPRPEGHDIYSGRPFSEEEREYFHDSMIWNMATTGIRVISAGTRSLDEIQGRLRDISRNAPLGYDIEVDVRLAKGNDDGTGQYSLEVKVLK